MTNITLPRELVEQVMEILKITHYARIDSGLLNQQVLNEIFTVHEALQNALKGTT